MSGSTRRPSEAELKPIQRWIDAMDASVVIVAPDGEIRYVNETWRRTSRANGGDQGSYYVGTNYLEICEKSSGGGPNVGSLVGAGLHRVLQGFDEFSAEYPCHTPSERRWFEIVARPFEIEEVRHVLITHRPVAADRSLAVEARIVARKNERFG